MKLLKDERYPTGIPAHLDPQNVIRKGRIQRAGTKMYHHEITEIQRMLLLPRRAAGDSTGVDSHMFFGVFGVALLGEGG